MKSYKKKYLKSIGAGQQDIVLCENPACRRVADHVHHVCEKGMGGRKNADELNNLIALCADCHQIAHSNDGRLPKEYLKEIARKRIEAHSRPKSKVF